MRKDATTDSPDTNSTNTTVASQVVSASVAGVTSGTRLSAPVRITLRLSNAPVLGTNETISGRRCVFWDYNAAGKTAVDIHGHSTCFLPPPPLQVVMGTGTQVVVT